MSGILLSLFAVMFLLEPEERIDAERARAISADADRVEIKGERPSAKPPEEKGQHARITAVTSDFDRQAGVAMFEGDVVLRYSSDYTLCADRLWAFLAGSNRLGRVVATGNVSITNETRVGTCEMAVYRRQRGEIEMFWNGTNALARLVENGDDASALEGTRIKFWIDTEQVEVDDTRIITEEERKGNKAKFL